MRILYLMHVSWFWAKQRPQFIAQHLSKDNTITVVYPQQFGKKQKEKEIFDPNLKLKIFRRIPGVYKIKLFGILHDFLVAFQLWSDIRKADLVWVTHPFLYRFLKYFNFRNNVKLVYDCMDDILEFPDTVNNLSRRKSMLELERSLVSKSNIVFTTSNYLSKKLKQRYGFHLDPKLVNNAINIDSFTKKPKEQLPNEIKECFRIDCINLIYVGTISSWLDLDLIRQSIILHDNLNYIFVGPSEMDLKNEERLKFPGAINHELVPFLLQCADILIMPFILSELILSVNPVKLYEYIYSNKPILSVRYDETEQFSPYVMLYKNSEEYNNIIQNIILEGFPVIDFERNQSFVRNNTWNNRVQVIQEYLQNEI